MTSLSIKMDRENAIFEAHQPLREMTGMLRRAGYNGPVVLAGGYLRDTATYRDPKDLDLFLDHDDALNARTLAYDFGQEMVAPPRIIGCYGSWASDVATVIQYPLGECAKWPWTEIPKPTSVDLVLLNRDELRNDGYLPARCLDDETEVSLANLTFLDACLSRVDLRINAIGITERFCRISPYWDEDAAANRLVVHKGRHDLKRITKRLARLQADKFAGWTAHMELDYDGSIGPALIGPASSDLRYGDERPSE